MSDKKSYGGKMNFEAKVAGDGDFFVIEDNEKWFVIDGGSKKTVDCNFNEVETIICTHNDSDHSNGIIAILNDSSITIKELWLPAYFQAIINFVIDNMENPDILFDIKMEIKNNYEAESILEVTSVLFEKIINYWRENFEKEGINALISKLNSIHRTTDHNSIYKMNFNIDKILIIAMKALQRNIRIRWFMPCAYEQNELIQFFNAKNSVEIISVVKIKDNSVSNFCELGYISKENKNSLVFEYIKNDIPVILFNSDNDLEFISNHLSYSNNILITAPHHGSRNNKAVYNKIKCASNSIWIRSGGTLKIVIASEFLTKTSRWCVKCNNIENNIILEYSNGIWQHRTGGFSQNNNRCRYLKNTL